MSGMYLSEIAIIAKPYQKMCFGNKPYICYFDENDNLYESSPTKEEKIHQLSREEMAEPKWEIIQ